jgi:hypothetical protein
MMTSLYGFLDQSFSHEMQDSEHPFKPVASAAVIDPVHFSASFSTAVGIADKRFMGSFSPDVSSHPRISNAARGTTLKNRKRILNSPRNE